MSGDLLNFLRCGVAAGALLLVPLPAALGLAPEPPDAAADGSIADEVQLLDLLGDGGDGLDAPDHAWPFGIPRWLEEGGAGPNDEPVRLAGDKGVSCRSG